MKNFRNCLITGLLLALPSLGYSKAPPCVQWYSSCQKSLYWSVPFRNGSTSNIYSITMDYEVLNQDGSVSAGTLRDSVTTKSFGPRGIIAIGIPNAISAISGKAALASSCRELKRRLDSAVCE